MRRRIIIFLSIIVALVVFAACSAFIASKPLPLIGGRFSCGTAGTPDVYRLTYTLKEDGIRKMSDGRIAALIEVLRHGSADARKQMIESFSDEVLQKTDGVIKD